MARLNEIRNKTKQFFAPFLMVLGGITGIHEFLKPNESSAFLFWLLVVLAGIALVYLCIVMLYHGVYRPAVRKDDENPEQLSIPAGVHLAVITLLVSGFLIAGLFFESKVDIDRSLRFSFKGVSIAIDPDETTTAASPQNPPVAQKVNSPAVAEDSKQLAPIPVKSVETPQPQRPVATVSVSVNAANATAEMLVQKIQKQLDAKRLSVPLAAFDIQHARLDVAASVLNPAKGSFSVKGTLSFYGADGSSLQRCGLNWGTFSAQAVAADRISDNVLDVMKHDANERSLECLRN